MLIATLQKWARLDFDPPRYSELRVREWLYARTQMYLLLVGEVLVF